EKNRSDRAPEGAGAAARGVTGPEGSGGGRGGGGLARPVQRSGRRGDRAPVRSGLGGWGGGGSCRARGAKPRRRAAPRYAGPGNAGDPAGSPDRAAIGNPAGRGETRPTHRSIGPGGRRQSPVSRSCPTW